MVGLKRPDNPAKHGNDIRFDLALDEAVGTHRTLLGPDASTERSFDPDIATGRDFSFEHRIGGDNRDSALVFGFGELSLEDGFLRLKNIWEPGYPYLLPPAGPNSDAFTGISEG